MEDSPVRDTAAYIDKRGWPAYLPSLAALLTCVLVLPVSEWIATGLAASAVLPPDMVSTLHSDNESVRPDEPIRPIPRPTGLNRQWVALGRELFHEPGLSKLGSVSCASCHSIEQGGDDGLEVSRGANEAIGSRNAPTVLNAALHFRQFWDGRVATLEEQVAGPIEHPSEMASDWAHVVLFLKADAAYSDWFNRAFVDGVTAKNVRVAIAEYERSLLTPDSAFDLWLKGDDEALTAAQLRGYRLFKANKCVGCHEGVVLGGSLFQPLGVMASYFDSSDSDAPAHQGRFAVTGDVRDRYVFKVPSLRNVARTAPYFHDGSAKTLEDAVRAMFDYQLGMPVEDEAVADILAFLQSLSAEPYEKRP